MSEPGADPNGVPAARGEGPIHSEQEVRRANRRFFLATAVLLLAFFGVAATLALTRENPRNFRHGTPTPEKRAAMIAALRAEMDAMGTVDRGGDGESALWRRQKILQVAIGVNEYALANGGDMPYSLFDIGLADELRDARWRLNRGGPHWRLYDGGKNLVARGD